MTAKKAADLKGSFFGLLQGPRSCWSIGAPQLSCTGGSDPPANTSLQSWGGAYPPTKGGDKPDVMQCRQGVLCHRRCTAETLITLREIKKGQEQQEVLLIRPVKIADGSKHHAKLEGPQSVSDLF